MTIKFFVNIGKDDQVLGLGLNPKPSTLNPQPLTLNPQPSITNGVDDTGPYNSDSGDAFLSGYGGEYRGVLFTPELGDGAFRQYGYLPLNLPAGGCLE